MRKRHASQYANFGSLRESKISEFSSGIGEISKDHPYNINETVAKARTNRFSFFKLFMYLTANLISVYKYVDGLC